MSKTYWNNEGKYQADYDRLWAKLVPDSGRAETMRGELLRAISRIYYDRFNNGFGNGPHTEENATLVVWARELGSAFTNFEAAFENTGFGEEGVEREWEGDAAMEKLVDRIIKVVKNKEARSNLK